ncbi:MAG: hypothetical protein WC107_00465 [Patescibacteria group bacterium]
MRGISLLVLGLVMLVAGTVFVGCNDSSGNDINVPGGDIADATIMLREWRFPNDLPVTTIPAGEVQTITPGVQFDIAVVDISTGATIPNSIVDNVQFYRRPQGMSNFEPIDFVDLEIVPNPGTDFVGWPDPNPLVGSNFFRRIEHERPLETFMVQADITISGVTTIASRSFVTYSPNSPL